MTGSRVATVVMLSVILVHPSSALEPVALVVKQADAPIEIVSYITEYRTEPEAPKEGIRHDVAWGNSSDRTVVAIEIGLASFSVFDEFIDVTGGVAIRPVASGKTDRGTWIARDHEEFSFLTGVAYVNKVRFEDGTVWRADLNDVAAQLRRIFSSDVEPDALQKDRPSD